MLKNNIVENIIVLWLIVLCQKSQSIFKNFWHFFRLQKVIKSYFAKYYILQYKLFQNMNKHIIWCPISAYLYTVASQIIVVIGKITHKLDQKYVYFIVLYLK